MKTTTDRDEDGIAERQEQLVQQRISAMLTTLFAAKKSYHIHQTTQLKHLGLCTVACIPEPVNDVDKLKQRLIEVWLAACSRPLSLSMRYLANEKEVSGSVAV